MTAPIAVAIGDPAGIGPEVIAKAWARRDAEALPVFFVVGDPRAIAAIWDGPTARIAEPGEASACFATALPVLHIADAGEIRPGHPDLEGARCALGALELAVGLACSEAARAIVTGPVSKAHLYKVGFTDPGQSEFIAQRCGIGLENTAMMLAGPSLRVVPMTVHIPLAAVAAALSIDLVVARARVAARGLMRDFGITQPRLAFAGLNPHAGESGAIGREEIDILRPAIDLLRSEGIDCIGPLAADTMFHADMRARYDAALCCYHDQALIPLKLLHFDEGVNFTLGLPIVRTSPDHGTAFDIAGTGAARPGAMIAAIQLAAAAAAHRQAYAQAHKV